MNRTLAALLVLGSSVLCAGATAEDPVRTKLDKAKSAYAAQVEKYRNSACDWFDQTEKAAREKGNKAQVDKIKEERKGFEERDELPDTAPTSLRRTLTTAKDDMEAAYRRAVAEYTKANSDAEATSVEQELAQFKKNAIPDPFDRFKAGSVWVGVNTQATAGKAKASAGRVTLTILDRTGEEFTARLRADTVERTIKGHVKGRTVWWSRNDVRVEKGAGPGQDNFGYVAGKSLRLRYEGFGPTGKPTLGFAEYRLDEGK